MGLLVLLLLSSPLAAQGGQYRGEGPLEAPAAPAPGPRLPLPAGGIVLTDDLTRWGYWWEFNKARYLQPLPSRPWRPTLDTLRDEGAPALRDALDFGEDSGVVNVTAAALIALAKINERGADVGLANSCRAALLDGAEPVASAATLALGIGGRAATALPVLRGLLNDDDIGRAACGGRPVTTRIRAFAAFALGRLAARRSTGPTARRIAANALRTVLRDEGSNGGADVLIASLHALGQCGLTPGTDPAGALREQSLRALLEYWASETTQLSGTVRQHIPPLVGKLGAHVEATTHPTLAELTRSAARAFHSRLAELEASDDPLQLREARGLVLALGMLLGRDGEPRDDALTRDIVGTLIHWSTTKADHQTRNFALLSLGRLGGAAAEARILEQLDKGSKALDTPWAALAAGLLVHHGLADSASIGPRLVDRLQQVKVPGTRGAIAIGLGLAGYTGAAPMLRSGLHERRHVDLLAANNACALAMLDDAEAFPAIRSLMVKSTRRPHRLVGTLQALLRDDDTTTCDTLVELLAEGNGLLIRQAALALTIGHLGTDETARQLVVILGDPERPLAARAYAAAALGCLAEPGGRPWNAAYAEDIDYRSVTPLMTDQILGLLDLL